MMTIEQREYLASESWLRTRAAMLRSTAQACETCGSTHALDVYAPFGNLPTQDTPTHELHVLCSSCRRWALRARALRDVLQRLLGIGL